MENKGKCLVVTTGMPYSGKSEVARYLSLEYRFARFNTDDMRRAVFSRNVEELKEYEEAGTISMLLAARDAALYSGFNAVMDSCAAYNEVRSWFLNVPVGLAEYLKERGSPLARYLVAIRSERKRLIERGMNREGISGEEAERRLALIDKIWEDIEVGDDVTVIEYENNLDVDIDLIKKDISQKIKPHF